MKLLLAIPVLLILTACAKDEGVAVYHVPKEEAPQAAPAAAAGTVAWTVPAGWKSEPASGMRLAAFSVPAKAGGTAEVTVVALPGEAGGDLANVNRWRGQLGLEPLDESALAAQSQRRTSPAGELLTVDFSAPGKGRMLAARLNSGGQAWFFKMTGPDLTVASAKPAFDGFLRSLHETR